MIFSKFLKTLLTGMFVAVTLCFAACHFFREAEVQSPQEKQPTMNKDITEVAIINTTEGAMAVELSLRKPSKTSKNSLKAAFITGPVSTVLSADL